MTLFERQSGTIFSMQRLTPNNVTAFLKRHSKFYDGVIKSAELTYAEAVKPPTPDLTIRVEVQDNESASGWCLLTLKLEGVSRLRIVENPGTNAVMSPNGASVLFAEGAVYLDLSPVTEDEYTLSDFEDSSFGVKSDQIQFDIETYYVT